jgi:hypothetical protein
MDSKFPEVNCLVHEFSTEEFIYELDTIEFKLRGMIILERENKELAERLENFRDEVVFIKYWIHNHINGCEEIDDLDS